MDKERQDSKPTPQDNKHQQQQQQQQKTPPSKQQQQKTPPSKQQQQQQQQQQKQEQKQLDDNQPSFTYEDQDHEAIIGAVGGGACAAELDEADSQRDSRPSCVSSKPFSSKRLARLSQARKLRKTRLSLGNFIGPSPAMQTEGGPTSSNSSESGASSYGSVPSDFDDLCNNS